MKKWFINILILIILIFNNGCSEWLQLEPESQLTREEFWQTGDDVEAVVAGSYKELTSLVDKLFKWGELRADLFVPGLNVGVDDRKIMDGYIYPENGLNRWDQLYRTINYANTVLKFSPVVVGRDQTFKENESKALEAEALYLRSLCYFYLVRIFRNVPLVLEASENDAQDYYPPVSSEQEIFLQIIDDLKIAVEDLPTSYSKVEYSKGRATKSSAYALMADVYLYFEKYQATIDACDEVIGSGLFGMIDGEDWFMNFFPGNSNESIFELQFDKDLNQTNSLYKMYAPAFDDTYPDGNDEFRVLHSSLKNMRKTCLTGEGETALILHIPGEAGIPMIKYTYYGNLLVLKASRVQQQELLQPDTGSVIKRAMPTGSFIGTRMYCL
jgi:hypothetical protein